MRFSSGLVKAAVKSMRSGVPSCDWPPGVGSSDQDCLHVATAPACLLPPVMDRVFAIDHKILVVPSDLPQSISNVDVQGET